MMKKQLFFLLLANAFLLMLSPISVYAQCNFGNAAPTGDSYGNSEYMMGQTITAPCAGRLTSFTFYTIGNDNYTATVKLRASACAGSVLSTGSAVVTSAGPVIVSNFSPTPNLTNGASYFILDVPVF